MKIIAIICVYVFAVALSGIAVSATLSDYFSHWSCQLTHRHKDIECTRIGAAWCDARIDDCIGNNNGRLVCGRDAGKSCKDYTTGHVDSAGGRQLFAKCRDDNGKFQNSVIRFSDCFVPVSHSDVWVPNKAMIRFQCSCKY